jgi:MFS family permease
MTGRLWTRGFLLAWLASLFYQIGFQLPWAGLVQYASLRGATASEAGLLTGLFALLALLLRPLAGWQIDRGRKRPVLMVGALIFVASAFGYLAAGSILLLLLVRTFNGCGHAAGQTANQALAAALAPAERRGEALSMQLLTLALATGLGPSIGVLIAGQAGFPAMFLTAGLCSLVTVGLAWLIPEPALGAPGRRRLVNTAVLRPGGILMALMIAFGAVVGLASLHAEQRGLANPGLIFLPYAAGMALIQLFGGRLSDRYGRGVAILPGLLLASLGMLGLALAQAWWLLPAAALFGVGVGLAQSNLIALAADYVAPNQRGSAIATAGMFLEGGISLGATLAGLIGQLAGLSTAFLALGLLPALALLLLSVTPWGATTLRRRYSAEP